MCSSLGAMSSTECSSNSECDSDSETPYDGSQSENPCGECCVMGCCECDYYLLATEKDHSPILDLEEKIKLKNEDARSSYLSECWKPPQAA